MTGMPSNSHSVRTTYREACPRTKDGKHSKDKHYMHNVMYEHIPWTSMIEASAAQAYLITLESCKQTNQTNKRSKQKKKEYKKCNVIL